MEITRSEITRRDKSAKIVRESLSLRDRYICVSIVFSAETFGERKKKERGVRGSYKRDWTLSYGTSLETALRYMNFATLRMSSYESGIVAPRSRHLAISSRERRSAFEDCSFFFFYFFSCRLPRHEKTRIPAK